MADRIAIMLAGRLQQFAPPQEVYRAPANRFVAGFIGMPSMNLIDGELKATPDGFRFRGAGLELPVPALRAGAEPGPACLGLRPEHLRIGDGPHQGTVLIVEQTGHENIVVFAVADGIRLTGRTRAELLPEVGQEIGFSVDEAAVHVFAAGDAGVRLNAT